MDDYKAMVGDDIMGRDREVVAMTKDGTEVPVEVTVSDVSIGRESLFCATVRDISARKEGELSRQVAHDKLQSALDEQMRVNQMQRDFVTMASHEFRTPLAIIDGGAQRILRRAGRLSEADLGKRINKIRDAVSRMQRLMESFLASAKTELGSIELKLKRCNLQEVVKKICDETETLTPSHTIDVDIADLPPIVSADRNLIGQVVVNLLSNATKFSPDADRLKVKGWSADGQAHISVQDFGVGIPPDEIEKVFGRFFRASTSSGIAGTGIGLNFVRHIVEQHGGSIDVQSVLGAGSIFTVHLPTGLMVTEGEVESAPFDTREPMLNAVG